VKAGLRSCPSPTAWAARRPRFRSRAPHVRSEKRARRPGIGSAPRRHWRARRRDRHSSRHRSCPARSGSATASRTLADRRWPWRRWRSWSRADPETRGCPCRVASARSSASDPKAWR
jgi:hypothetical protein